MEYKIYSTDLCNSWTLVIVFAGISLMRLICSLFESSSQTRQSD